MVLLLNLSLECVPGVQIWLTRVHTGLAASCNKTEEKLSVVVSVSLSWNPKGAPQKS